MERKRARELVEQIVEHAKREAVRENCDPCAFSLGWLKACAEDFLAYLPEDNFYVKFHAEISNS